MARFRTSRPNPQGATMNLTIPLALLAAASLQAGAPEDSPAAKGKYLVTIMGCADCHTPMKMGPKGPEPDMARHLSGHPSGMQVTGGPDLGQGPWVWAGTGSMTAFSGPWGVSFAANLTPDKETGLGSVSAKDFLQIFRTGRHLGKGRPVLPPMPLPAYSQAKDEDLMAIYAYLQTLPPVRNQVPDVLPPPARP
jgi:mono/diheme cytochrome c family protein